MQKNITCTQIIKLYTHSNSRQLRYVQKCTKRTQVYDITNKENT